MALAFLESHVSMFHVHRRIGFVLHRLLLVLLLPLPHRPINYNYSPDAIIKTTLVIINSTPGAYSVFVEDKMAN